MLERNWRTIWGWMKGTNPSQNLGGIGEIKLPEEQAEAVDEETRKRFEERIQMAREADEENARTEKKKIQAAIVDTAERKLFQIRLTRLEMLLDEATEHPEHLPEISEELYPAVHELQRNSPIEERSTQRQMEILRVEVEKTEGLSDTDTVRQRLWYIWMYCCAMEDPIIEAKEKRFEEENRTGEFGTGGNNDWSVITYGNEIIEKKIMMKVAGLLERTRRQEVGPNEEKALRIASGILCRHHDDGRNASKVALVKQAPLSWGEIYTQMEELEEATEEEFRKQGISGWQKETYEGLYVWCLEACEAYKRETMEAKRGDIMWEIDTQLMMAVRGGILSKEIETGETGPIEVMRKGQVITHKDLRQIVESLLARTQQERYSDWNLTRLKERILRRTESRAELAPKKRKRSAQRGGKGRNRVQIGRARTRHQGVGFQAGEKTGRAIHIPEDGHLITIGATGTGKTSTTIIPAVLEHEGPVVVIDPKGQVYDVTHRHRRERGDGGVADCAVRRNRRREERWSESNRRD